MTLLSGYFIINMLINSFDPIIGWAESISFRLFLPKLKPESNTVIFWFSISRKGEKRDREKIGVKNHYL